MIAEFPHKKWKIMAYEASNSCTEVDRKRVEEMLGGIDEKLIRKPRGYDKAKAWIDNALLQQTIEQFHAIIAAANPDGRGDVLTRDDLNEKNALWAIQREAIISRTAEEMASYAAKLLNISSEILFIDPHFKPQELRFRRPLELFLRETIQGAKIRRIEYHTKCDEDGMSREFFEQKCNEQIAPLIPKGVELTFFRWRPRIGGDAFHARYILTEKGGMRFEHGLDDSEEGVTSDVSLLDTSLYRKRWDSFQIGTPAYDLIDRLVLIGRGRIF